MPLLVAVAFIASVLVTTTLVMAHASPERSEPAPNSVLARAPTQVSMWFTEPLEPAFSQIQVLDSTSKRVNAGNSGVDSNDPKRMSVSLSQLPNGTYTVAWKTLSTVDGHSLRGSYVFSVGEAPAGGPSPLDVKAPLLQSPLDPPVRWLVLLGGMAILGGLVFEMLILSPLLKPDPRQVPALTLARRRMRKLLIASALLFLIASGVQAVIQTATASDESLFSISNLPIRDVILNTEWGQVWIWRVSLLAIALGLLIVGSSLKGAAKNAVSWLALGTSAGMMLTLSWVSHGAAVEGIRMQALFSDYAHLVASSVWIGGLFSFAILIWSINKRTEPTQRDQILSSTVPRFSVLATLCVGTLIITGIFNSWAQVNSVGAFDTPYGFALIAKLLLIVPLLALAALNLLWVRRRLEKHRDRSGEASVWLKRFVTGEVLLAGLVVLSVGMMLSLQPARQVEAEERRQAGINRSLTVDTTKIDIRMEPGSVGANRATVSLRNAIDDPITNASLVSLRFTFLNADVGSVTASAKHTGNGVYIAEGIALSIRGAWVGTVRIARPDSLDVIGSIQFILADTGADVGSTPSQSTGRVLLLLEFLLIGALFAGVGFVIGGFGTSAGTKVVSPGLVCIAAGVTVFLVTSSAAVSPPQTTSGIPTPSQSQGRNPIVNGRALFTEHCTVCHGAAGRGDGPLAPTLNPPPLDLQVHAPLHTDPELYRFIARGIPGTSMTNWEKTLKPDDIWDIVFYLRILTQPVNTSDVN